MGPMKQYVQENVFCRCGQAVTALTEAGLLERPVMPNSENEIHEWWLVSRDLAERLLARNRPVLQFAELYLWGREATGIELPADPDLIDIVAQLRPPPGARLQAHGARPARKQRGLFGRSSKE